jgi:hypothetical protein
MKNTSKTSAFRTQALRLAVSRGIKPVEEGKLVRKLVEEGKLVEEVPDLGHSLETSKFCLCYFDLQFSSGSYLVIFASLLLTV